jgi:NAD(P)H dehydrogenase (quinone)
LRRLLSDNRMFSLLPLLEVSIMLSIVYSIPGVRYVQSKLNQITSYFPPPPAHNDDGSKAKILLIHCHPIPDSYSATIAKTFMDAATISGHEVRRISLYEHPDDPTKCYRPNLSRLERENYFFGLDFKGNGEQNHKKSYRLAPEVQCHLDLLRWCDTLVFVYPTWWMNTPASLKGFFDRTLLAGFTWEFPSKTTSGASLGLVPKLTNIKKIVAISTYGASQAIVTLAGDNGRSMISNAIRHSVCPNASVLWVGLYGVDTATNEQRELFLNKVATLPKIL